MEIGRGNLPINRHQRRAQASMGVQPVRPGQIALPNGGVVNVRKEGQPDPNQIVALCQFLATMGFPIDPQIVVLLRTGQAHLIPNDVLQPMATIREAVVREWSAFVAAVRAAVPDAVMVLPVPTNEQSAPADSVAFGVLKTDNTFLRVTVSVAVGDAVESHPYKAAPAPLDENERPS